VLGGTASKWKTEANGMGTGVKEMARSEPQRSAAGEGSRRASGLCGAGPGGHAAAPPPVPLGDGRSPRGPETGQPPIESPWNPAKGLRPMKPKPNGVKPPQVGVYLVHILGLRSLFPQQQGQRWVLLSDPLGLLYLDFLPLHLPLQMWVQAPSPRQPGSVCLWLRREMYRNPGSRHAPPVSDGKFETMCWGWGAGAGPAPLFGERYPLTVAWHDFPFIPIGESGSTALTQTPTLHPPHRSSSRPLPPPSAPCRRAAAALRFGAGGPVARVRPGPRGP